MDFIHRQTFLNKTAYILLTDFCLFLVPRRQKSAPASPSIGDRVSAALTSRDEGDCRATEGDPGQVAPPWGELLPDLHFCLKPLIVAPLVARALATSGATITFKQLGSA